MGRDAQRPPKGPLEGWNLTRVEREMQEPLDAWGIPQPGDENPAIARAGEGVAS